MRKIRVYVDTSVFGGVNDEEFAEPSRRFFERVRAGDFVIVVSDEVTREIAGAPPAVRRVLSEVPQACIEQVDVDDEVEALAQAYLDAGVVGPGSKEDAVHVAAATIGRADLLLSWNFRHLVRYDRIRMFNGVNVLNRYSSIDIRSPLEIVHGDD